MSDIPPPSNQPTISQEEILNASIAELPGYPAAVEAVYGDMLREAERITANYYALSELRAQTYATLEEYIFKDGATYSELEALYVTYAQTGSDESHAALFNKIDEVAGEDAEHIKRAVAQHRAVFAAATEAGIQYVSFGDLHFPHEDFVQQRARDVLNAEDFVNMMRTGNIASLFNDPDDRNRWGDGEIPEELTFIPLQYKNVLGVTPEAVVQFIDAASDPWMDRGVYNDEAMRDMEWTEHNAYASKLVLDMFTPVVKKMEADFHPDDQYSTRMYEVIGSFLLEQKKLAAFDAGRPLIQALTEAFSHYTQDPNQTEITPPVLPLNTKSTPEQRGHYDPR
jgi:hypothetical protein